MSYNERHPVDITRFETGPKRAEKTPERTLRQTLPYAAQCTRIYVQS